MFNIKFIYLDSLPNKGISERIGCWIDELLLIENNKMYDVASGF